MGKATRCPSVAALAALLLLSTASSATTYRVGPNEKHAKVSEVSARLKAGDLVEITGDVVDSATVAAIGSSDRPVVIRGITRVESGRIIRPQLRPESESVPFSLNVSGNWIVVEGLGFTGFRGREFGKAALVISGSDTLIRNCHFHHNLKSLGTDDNMAGDTLVELCEFESDGYGPVGPVCLYSKVPGATLTVQHCYFHSNTGNHLLRACYPRNVIRYNWFEDQNHFAVQLGTSLLYTDTNDHTLADKLLPAHTDILGNVFVSAWMSNAYGTIQVGGGEMAPGPEGDINIAHNLFLGRRGGNIPFNALEALGNIDRINMYNNAFVDARHGGLMVYSREPAWDVPRTALFRAGLGGADPVVTGHANWVSVSAGGLPEGFTNTISGVDPGVYSFVECDFRPTSVSPLAGKGLWPIPDGRMISLTPEYEPQRGIPVDLKPRTRRSAQPPSIGPFEVAGKDPFFKDDSADLVLGVSDVGTITQWQLNFGGARRLMLEYLAKGEPAKALQCARMQFILSPPDERTVGLAVESVKQALVAVDGNNKRAKVFDVYARQGAAGKDGRVGTADDLCDPIPEVTAAVFERPREFYEQFDATLDKRAAMGIENLSYAFWWEQRWYRTQKAFARIEGGDFDEALSLLIPLVADLETMAQPSGADFNGKTLRTQNYLERLAEGLAAVSKGRTGTAAGISESVERCKESARYGPAGRDTVLGTADDVDLCFGNFGPGAAEFAGPFENLLADLTSSYPGSPELRAVERRVMATAGAGAIVERKMNYIARETATGHRGEYMFLLPSARDLLEALRLNAGYGAVDWGAFTEEERSAIESSIDAALESCDRRVVDAYKRLVAGGVDEPTAARARPFVTAYLLGSRDRSAYPAMLTFASVNLAGGDTPLFLVDDAAAALSMPFAAAALDALKQWPIRDADSLRLAKIIEEGEYEAVRTAGESIKNLNPSAVTARLQGAIDVCNDYLNRFPSGRYAAFMGYERVFFTYSLGNSAGTVSEAETFLARWPDSEFAAKALFMKGSALVTLGDVNAGAALLIEVDANFPESDVVASALFVAGKSCAMQGDYNKAVKCFQRIVDFHAGSAYAPKAREFIGKLAVPRTK